MFNLFKKEKVTSNKCDFSKIINAEDLNKIHQKTWEDSINELEKKVKRRRIILVETITRNIVDAANSGCYSLMKRMRSYSMDDIYKYYEFPKGDKGNGKEWIDSLIESLRKNGYKIKIDVKEYSCIRKEVVFYISWR